MVYFQTTYNDDNVILLKKLVCSLFLSLHDKAKHVHRVDFENAPYGIYSDQITITSASDWIPRRMCLDGKAISDPFP